MLIQSRSMLRLQHSRKRLSKNGSTFYFTPQASSSLLTSQMLGAPFLCFEVFKYSMALLSQTPSQAPKWGLRRAKRNRDPNAVWGREGK